MLTYNVLEKYNIFGINDSVMISIAVGVEESTIRAWPVIATRLLDKVDN